jgi:hypothetical protein
MHAVDEELELILLLFYLASFADFILHQADTLSVGQYIHCNQGRTVGSRFFKEMSHCRTNSLLFSFSPR